MFKNGCIDVLQSLFGLVSTLRIRLRILFHFQRRINVISTSIHNVETTLIQQWNVGWVVSTKKLILRNILPATLLQLKLVGIFQGLFISVAASDNLFEISCLEALVYNRCLLKAFNIIKITSNKLRELESLI